MRKHKVLYPLVSVLLSLLLIGLNSQIAFAAKKAILSLRSADINASIVDPAKNILKIQNGASIDPKVTVKPTKKTLKNGRPVAVTGEVNDEGDLEVDLSALGPANLIPSGEYIVNAKQGKRKLSGKFNYNAPTLIIGKLQVPLPDSTGAVKARILRKQTTGEETIPEETSDIPDANCALYDPLTQEPIEDVPTVAVPGTEALDENGNPIVSYQLLYEIPYNIANDPENPVENPVIRASTTAETSTGETQEITLSAVAFPEDASANNVISNVVVNAASDSAADIITAALVESENKLGSSDIPLKATYEQTVATIEPAIESASTIDQALKSAETAVAVGSTDIYKGIYEDLKDLINVDPEQAAEIAADLCWKAPEIVKQAPEDLIKEGAIDDLPINTYAAGFFKVEELGEGVLPPSQESQARAYEEGKDI